MPYLIIMDASQSLLAFHTRRLRHLPETQRNEILSRYREEKRTEEKRTERTNYSQDPTYTIPTTLPASMTVHPKPLSTKLYRVVNKDTFTDRPLIKLPIPQMAYVPGTTILKRQNIQGDRKDTHTVFYGSSQTSQKGLPSGFYPVRFISPNGYINKDYGLVGIIPLLFKTFPDLKLSKRQLDSLLYRFAYWWQFRMSCTVSSFGKEFEEMRIIGLHFDYNDGVFIRRVLPHLRTLKEPDQIFVLQKDSISPTTIDEEMNKYITIT